MAVSWINAARPKSESVFSRASSILRPPLVQFLKILLRILIDASLKQRKGDPVQSGSES